MHIRTVKGKERMKRIYILLMDITCKIDFVIVTEQLTAEFELATYKPY